MTKQQAQATTAATAIKLKDGDWTPEAEAALADRYTGNDMNEQLGSLVEGKSAAAVRSKLVSMGKYEKNEPKAVGGASSNRKMDSVRAIETMLSMKRGSLDSLEKGRKSELEQLAESLAKLGDQPSADKKA